MKPFFKYLGYQPNQQLIKEGLQNNIFTIMDYLDYQDIQHVKLTSRFLYYQIVSRDIWTGLKWGIAQEKMEHYDYDFIEQQPKFVSKKDKNIRIHSLKKSAQTKVVRQSSNVKQKGKNMDYINELNFRNTQIGFKRLLKSNKKVGDPSYNETQSLLELPKASSFNDYIINSNDAWSINMHRCHKLTQIIKKWNQFHHKFLSSLKKEQRSWKGILKKLKQRQKDVKIYKQKFGEQLHSQVIESITGAKNNLLIDEQLNKVAKLFLTYHESMANISNTFTPFHQQLNTINFLINIQEHTTSSQFLDIIGKIDQNLQKYTSITQKYVTISKIVSANIIQLYSVLLQKCEKTQIEIEGSWMSIQGVEWKHLVRRPQLFELIFQILISICSKLIKVISCFCFEDLSMNKILGKIQNMKVIGQSLWNISKYFYKLTKQIESKQKKGKDGKLRYILSFMKSYESKSPSLLYEVQNPSKIDKMMNQFKDNIGELKNKMHSS